MGETAGSNGMSEDLLADTANALNIIVLKKIHFEVLRDKAELRAALQHLLAKPRCPRCRKAAQAILERTK